MHTLRYVSTNVCGRMRKSASTLAYAKYVSDKFLPRYCTLVYVVKRRIDPQILCLHKKIFSVCRRIAYTLGIR